MIEFNFDNPLARQIRACRRIVLQNGVDVNSIDPAWREKLIKGTIGSGGRSDIILSNPKTEVPKGFKVVAQMEDGQDMGYPTNDFDKVQKRAVHICHGHGKFDGNGMKYRWVPVEKST